MYVTDSLYIKKKNNILYFFIRTDRTGLNHPFKSNYI